jgi:Tfp pilus assembly protein PilF
MQLKRRISHVHGYLGLGLVEEAAAEIERIEDANQQIPEVMALRLAILEHQQNWPAVVALAAEFVRQSPDEPAAWIAWAYGTRRADSLAAAEKILREAEQKHPANATIQFNLGCYACQQGDLATARQCVDRAIALDPEFASIAKADPDLAPLRTADRKRRAK